MVSYSLEDIKFEFKHKRLNNAWLKMVAESEVKKLGNICIIFCSDNYILDVNIKRMLLFLALFIIILPILLLSITVRGMFFQEICSSALTQSVRMRSIIKRNFQMNSIG